jgi:hypothetical protein
MSLDAILVYRAVEAVSRESLRSHNSRTGIASVTTFLTHQEEGGRWTARFVCVCKYSLSDTPQQRGSCRPSYRLRDFLLDRRATTSSSSMSIGGRGRDGTHGRAEHRCRHGAHPLSAIGFAGPGCRKPCTADPRTRLRAEGHLVVDRIEGVLCQLLRGLHVRIPQGAASVRLGRRVDQDLGDGQARRPTKRRTRIDEGAAAILQIIVRSIAIPPSGAGAVILLPPSAGVLKYTSSAVASIWPSAWHSSRPRSRSRL